MQVVSDFVFNLFATHVTEFYRTCYGHYTMDILDNAIFCLFVPSGNNIVDGRTCEVWGIPSG
jgi:hypothetical protein